MRPTLHSRLICEVEGYLIVLNRLQVFIHQTTFPSFAVFYISMKNILMRLPMKMSNIHVEPITSMIIPHLYLCSCLAMHVA